MSVGEVPESAESSAARAESVLAFWFASDPDGRAETFRACWFVPSPEFDELCRTQFRVTYEDAANGRLEKWRNEPRSCLALILLLDQFPRNMFRGTARAFASDPAAREICLHAIASDFDRELSPLMRMFLYLPLQHSENLDDQLESVRLSRALPMADPEHTEILEQAEQHLEIIRRFGRFPARNRALGRQSTQEEMDFLNDQS